MIIKNLLQSSTVYAASTTVDIDSQVKDYFGYSDIGHFISNIVNVIIIIASVAFFAYLVMGGFQYLTSGGNKDQIETAKKSISNAIIGLTIITASWAIWKIVLYFFGIDIDLS